MMNNILNLKKIIDELISFIPDKKHVKNYLGKKEAKIWILGVYELDEPKYVRRSAGMLYANVDSPIKLEGKPVLSDDEFEKLKDNIINTK